MAWQHQHMTMIGLAKAKTIRAKEGKVLALDHLQKRPVYEVFRRGCWREYGWKRQSVVRTSDV